MMVSTLYGKVRDDGKYDVVDGAFDESFINYYGVQEPTWFSFNRMIQQNFICRRITENQFVFLI